MAAGTVASWLVLMIGPLARKAAVALGLGTVTFVGLQAALTAAITAAQTAYGGLAAGPAALMALSGCNTAISIVLGALTARIGLVQLKRFQVKAS